MEKISSEVESSSSNLNDKISDLENYNNRIRIETESLSQVSQTTNNLSESLLQIVVFISILIALFYSKIPANWSIAFKIALFLIAMHVLNALLNIPLIMNWYDIVDTITSHVINAFVDSLLTASFLGFLSMVVFTGMDKLYRKAFPKFISLGNLFHLNNSLVFSLLIYCFKVLKLTNYLLIYLN